MQPDTTPAPIGADALREAAYVLIEACERDWPSTPRHRAAVLKHAAELRAALASAAQPPTDGWLQAGHLLYRLTDERRPQNRDEIAVTMADGSRTPEACARRAGELLDFIRAVPKAAPAPAAVAGPSEDEDRLFAAWLTRELCLPTDADLTQYDAAYLPYRAWKARAALAAPAPAAQGDAPEWIRHGHTFGGKPRLALEIDPSDFYGITEAIHHALEQLGEHEDPDASPLDPKRSRRLRQALMAAWLREYPQEAARAAKEGASNASPPGQPV